MSALILGPLDTGNVHHYYYLKNGGKAPVVNMGLPQNISKSIKMRDNPNAFFLIFRGNLKVFDGSPRPCNTLLQESSALEEGILE